ncbi:MAG TPA: type III-A CRISPR-associated protein Csm2 [Bacteroidales bacterium]|nr:type III-A CRISPR-associated protein Csm2 [Bacteroidales bacterium]
MTVQSSNPKQGGGFKPPIDSRNYVNDFKTDWIKIGIDKDCIQFTDEFGRFLKNNQLTTSQIRNVFGELKRIQMKGFKEEKTAFLLLKPKMAYAVARDGKKGLQQLTSVFNKAYDVVDVEGKNGPMHFQNLMDLMESILAYHKAYGGK